MTKKLLIVLLALAASLCLAFGIIACSGKIEESESKKGTIGLAYQTNSDLQSYSVTGIGEATDNEIVIPDTYNGLPVTDIADSAFSGITGITSITIPDSVTSIGESAFSNCTSLTSVTIGSSVTEIGDYAFRECTSLTNVYITNIAAWCGIEFTNYTANPLYYAGNLYLNGELTTELVIPNGVTSICDYVFCGYTSLTNITIPNSVTSIGEQAFLGCTSLISITIPDSVTFIGSWAFGNCTAEIIWQDNPSITEIGYYAFSNYAGTSITIPNSVTSIGELAFFYCYSLESITIPDSVTYIGKYAFYDCTSLTSVAFVNTEGWQVYHYLSMAENGTSISSADLENSETAATHLTSTYASCYWKRS